MAAYAISFLMSFLIAMLSAGVLLFILTVGCFSMGFLQSQSQGFGLPVWGYRDLSGGGNRCSIRRLTLFLPLLIKDLLAIRPWCMRGV